MRYIDGGTHNGVEYHIHHHGDFSGNVKIIHKVAGISDDEQPCRAEIEIPMDVIRRIVAQEIMERRISRVEDMSIAELLFGESE
jgi:hypothetical protein